MAGTRSTSERSESLARLVVALLVAAAAALAVPWLAAAAPGDPDPEFGDGGVAQISDPSESETVTSAAADADRRILIASRSGGTTVVDRLLPNGAVDPGFGQGGRARLDLGEGQEIAEGIAVDGSAVLTAGYVSDGPSTRFLVNRLTPEGTLDPGFGAGGSATAPFEGDARANAVAVARDGSLVVAGETDGSSKGPSRDLAVARYTASGELDSSFADGGIWSRDLARGKASGDEWVEDIVINDHGGIVFAGAAGPRNDSKWMIVGRLKPSGKLDRSFGDGGIRRVFVSKARTAVGTDLTIDFKGRIALAGRVQIAPGSRDQIALARLSPVGDLDRGFAKGGRLKISIDGEPADVAFDRAKIVVAGKASPSGFSRSGVALRVTRKGELDKTFGERGLVRIVEGEGQTRSAAILTSQAGRYLVVGEALGPGPQGPRTQIDPAVAALESR